MARPQFDPCDCPDPAPWSDDEPEPEFVPADPLTDAETRDLAETDARWMRIFRRIESRWLARVGLEAWEILKGAAIRIAMNKANRPAAVKVVAKNAA